MRIVVDAMGTDNRPTPDVAGGVEAARAYGETIILVGDEQQIRKELARHQTAGLPVEVVHAADEIHMTDKPSNVMKSKPDSSMHVGMNLVKSGDADAFVTMGNTGAAHAIATLATIKRIRGVKRPALTAVYPIHGHEVIMLDVGANADSRAEWLVQFALMGDAYAKAVYKRPAPRVATLSNGEEEGKGNQLTRDVQDALRKLPINYVGHVEPKDIVNGEADIVVMDGFVGNIFIKTFEVAISYISSVIRTEMTSNVLSSLGALLVRPALRRVRNQVDPSDIGGAPLLGVDGIVIIGHGSSDAHEVKSAINQARKAVQAGAIDMIKAELESAGV